MLVWNYGVMSVLAGVAGVLFWLSVRDLDANEDELNDLKRGRISPRFNDQRNEGGILSEKSTV